jgi:hypothetical protein
MAFKIRPTGLGSGAYTDDSDCAVYSGEWEIGRIYERKGFPDDVRFFWSIAWRCSDETAWHPHRWRRGDAGSCEGRVWGELEAVA